MDKKNSLNFEDFSTLSRKEWEKKIFEEIKETDIKNKRTNEDISNNFFYLKEDLPPKSFIDTLHYIFRDSSTWKVSETIYVSNLDEASQNAAIARDSGAEAIEFIIDPGVRINNTED